MNNHILTCSCYEKEAGGELLHKSKRPLSRNQGQRKVEMGTSEEKREKLTAFKPYAFWNRVNKTDQLIQAAGTRWTDVNEMRHFQFSGDDQDRLWWLSPSPFPHQLFTPFPLLPLHPFLSSPLSTSPAAVLSEVSFVSACVCIPVLWDINRNWSIMNMCCLTWLTNNSKGTESIKAQWKMQVQCYYIKQTLF